jgi:hypothetical protein
MLRSCHLLHKSTSSTTTTLGNYMHAPTNSLYTHLQIHTPQKRSAYVPAKQNTRVSITTSPALNTAFPLRRSNKTPHPALRSTHSLKLSCTSICLNPASALTFNHDSYVPNLTSTRKCLLHAASHMKKLPGQRRLPLDWICSRASSYTVRLA